MSEVNRYSKYEPLFGSWYIRDKIGQGAIGEVYEIERTDLGTTYKAALKAITIPENPDDIKRVISSGVAREDLDDYYRNLISNIANEFKYLARLKGNSYIVNYEDHIIIESPDELRWDVLIKTELLTPLVEHALENPIGEEDVLRLGIDICRALKFCGQYNILHRDIKPENIFIAPSGDFKLGDFGIARMVEETTYMNLSRKGTYTYMAPEVFRGLNYNQSADLYSLGLVMYKYLNNGRVPFMPPYPEKIAFDDPEKAFTERVSGKPLPEPQTGSAKLRRIVLKACAFSPDDRYESAEEMLTDLESLYIAAARKKRRLAKKGKRGIIKDKRSTGSVHKPAAPESAGPVVTTGKIVSDSEKPSRRESDADRDRRVSDSHRGRRLALAASLILLLLAGAIYAMIPKEVTDITGIDPEIQLYYDGSLKPEYVVEPDWFKDEPIQFKSGDDKVFTVSDQGEIKASSIGEADLLMNAKDYTETVHVSIVPKVTSISGIDKTYSIYEGNTVQLEPKLEPKEFADEPVTYKSSDENVATVDKTGMITAVSVGDTKVTISAGGSSTTAKISVSALPVVSRTTYNSKSSGSSSKSSNKSTKSSSKSSKSTKKSSSKKAKSSKESFGDEEYF